MVFRLILLVTVLVVTGFPEILAAQDSSSELSSREERRYRRVSHSVRQKALVSVCRDVSNLSGLLLKTTAGGHIPPSDPRNSGYSIICASRCAPFPATVYHCDGSIAFKMGYYGKWSGNGKSRGYCGAGGVGACSVSSIRARARRLGCQGAGYLDIDGSRGKACLRFNLNSDRNGSV